LLTGTAITATADSLYVWTHVLSFIVEFGYQYTSFSGNMPIGDLISSPVYYGTARVSFLSGGGGFEVRL